jgi:hypothetical protein
MIDARLACCGGIMNESEFQAIYQELAEALASLELGWVVAQVDEQVRLGKAVSKRVRTLEPVRYQEVLPGLPPAHEREYEVDFATLVEYTNQERLLLLVEALKHALVNVMYMAYEFTRFFSEEDGNLQEIKFYQDGEPVTFTFEFAAFRRNRAVYLRRLLDGLYIKVIRDIVIQSSTVGEIADAIEKVLEPGLELESLAPNIFEVYIFSLIIQAAKAEGAQVSYQDVHGKSPKSLEFLSGLGNIYSQARPYTHAVVKFRRKPVLEAHIGVRIAGKSQVLHTSNIALLLQSEAQVCRKNQVLPRSSKVVLSATCKFHSTCVPLYLARAFMGLDADLAARDCYFVVNTLSDPVSRLLDHHRKYWEHQIFPGSAMDIVRFQRMLQTSFKNFQDKF